ncbi:MAG: hypothetical protein IPJ94_11360 [Chloroflexi bacterium]|nr:hypothetical protein [Chloroflexota bacterium]
MAIITFSFTLASPLLVGEPHQGNTYQSYNFVPGSVLRGAVADVLMATWTHEQRAKPHPDECPDPSSCPLCRVFYPQDADGRFLSPPRFYDCYPAVSGSQAVYPFPQTARTCKRHGGFLRDKSEETRHGVMDTLLRQAAAREAAQSGQPLPYVYTLTCPACDEALKTPEGDVYGRYEAYFYTARPFNRRFSRTAINRRRHTAQPGQLFTLTVMGEQMKTDLPKPIPEAEITHLMGTLDPGAADLDLLKEALGQVRWLGSSKSRGLGQLDRVKIERGLAGTAVTPLTLAAFQAQVRSGQFTADPDMDQDMGQRLAAFNQAAAAERAFYHALGLTNVLSGGWYFTVDLLTDTFVRAGGLPTLELTAEMLELPGAELVFMAAEPVNRGGWNGAWGLPQPRYLGIQAGGVYLFRVNGRDPDTVQALWTRLEALQQEGIGYEQERGAGRVLICAPFHQEVDPK